MRNGLQKRRIPTRVRALALYAFGVLLMPTGRLIFIRLLV
jgi:hypothetical protein